MRELSDQLDPLSPAGLATRRTPTAAIPRNSDRYLTLPLTASNTNAGSSKWKIPKAEPTSICTLALISRVNGSSTVAPQGQNLWSAAWSEGIQKQGVNTSIPMLAGRSGNGGFT